MRLLPFLLPYLIPASVVACYFRGGLWAFGVVSWIYIAVPWLDSVLGRDRSVRPPDLSPAWHEDLLCRLLLWLWVPTQAALILWALVVIETHDADPFECWAIACSLGMTGGIVGITAAHELAHARSPWDRSLAVLLMALSTYPHFCIEHVLGHHRNVATPGDPATARLGENLYAFLLRCVPGGVRHAWLLETHRLHRMGRSVWSNRMLLYAVLILALYAGIAVGFGLRGVLVFAAQSLVAVFLLESINYVQHYGLVRSEKRPGRFEPVRPWHAWNVSHRLSNWMLFNLGQHSDHHCQARVPFQSLRNSPEAPHLPAGYAAMVVLAMFPPLWQLVMDRRVLEWRTRYQSLREDLNEPATR